MTAHDAALDRDDPRPLWVQLRDALAGEIAGHTLLPGDPLPTEAELQARHGVARSVVRQALSALADEGWIRRSRGRGSVVAVGGDHRRELQRAGGLGEQMAAAGSPLTTEILDVRRAGPPSAARDALGTTDTWRIERLRRVGDEPVVLVRTWVPLWVFPDPPRARLAVTTLHELMREHGHAPEGGRRHVQAVPADAHVARRLGVEPGTPLLLLEGVTRDADGRGLEWFGVWHSPNTVFDIDAHVTDDRTAGERPADGGERVARLRDLVDRLAVEVAALPDDGRSS